MSSVAAEGMFSAVAAGHARWTLLHISDICKQFSTTFDHLVSFCMIYYRRLGGGAPRPNWEILPFPSCARVRGLVVRWELASNLLRATFPFPFASRALPFSLGVPPPTFYPASAGLISMYEDTYVSISIFLRRRHCKTTIICYGPPMFKNDGTQGSRKQQTLYTQAASLTMRR